MSDRTGLSRGDRNRNAHTLTPGELDQLIADLKPISAALDAAGSR